MSSFISTKIILVLLFLISGHFTTLAQNRDSVAVEAKKEELKAVKDSIEVLEKQARLLKEELTHLKDSLKTYPIWNMGLFGTAGFNFTRFQDWLSKSESSTSASTISYTANGNLHLEQPKYFWRNNLTINQSWLRFDNKEIEEEENGYQIASDAFSLNSLLGYKISEKLAASGLLEYRTALLQKRWNNPGFLDVGVGMSWTPSKTMFFSVNPLNYNAIFSNSEAELSSSFGAKIIGEFSRKFPSGISWRSNLSAFYSYKSAQSHNWIWTNGLSTSIKKIGIGLDVSFKQNRQEAIANNREDNPFQFYYILGLTYQFQK